MEDKELINTLQTVPAHEGLAMLGKMFGAKAKFSTSLGQEDQVLAHLIAEHAPTIEVFTLDTGRLFYETYDLIARTEKKLNLPIKIWSPDAVLLQNLVDSQGINGFYDGVPQRKNCCEVRKMKPLRKALEGTKIWITGLRAGQSQNRAQMPLVEYDQNFGVLKYNPLLQWSLEEIEAYLDQHNVPQNPLHKKGFVSIGCAPCTRAIAPGEDLRAGRWWWENTKKECGLHSVSQSA